jgi:hypothetical protein
VKNGTVLFLAPDTCQKALKLLAIMPYLIGIGVPFFALLKTGFFAKF